MLLIFNGWLLYDKFILIKYNLILKKKNIEWLIINWFYNFFFFNKHRKNYRGGNEKIASQQMPVARTNPRPGIIKRYLLFFLPTKLPSRTLS